MKSSKNPTIGIFTAFSAVSVVLFGWLSWVSIRSISLGEQAAAVVEWQNSTTANLNDYQQKSDQRMEKIGSDVSQLKSDTATNKALLKLISVRYQINSDAVESRVENDIRNQASTSNTLTVN